METSLQLIEYFRLNIKNADKQREPDSPSTSRGVRRLLNGEP